MHIKKYKWMSNLKNNFGEKYSQLDKEGLTVIFPKKKKKIHRYIFGRNLTITTDHKLITLLSETKPVLQMDSPRVKRWAVLLRAYEHYIVQRKITSYDGSNG